MQHNLSEQVNLLQMHFLYNFCWKHVDISFLCVPAGQPDAPRVRRRAAWRPLTARFASRLHADSATLAWRYPAHDAQHHNHDPQLAGGHAQPTSIQHLHSWLQLHQPASLPLHHACIALRPSDKREGWGKSLWLHWKHWSERRGFRTMAETKRFE